MREDDNDKIFDYQSVPLYPSLAVAKEDIHEAPMNNYVQKIFRLRSWNKMIT